MDRRVDSAHNDDRGPAQQQPGRTAKSAIQAIFTVTARDFTRHVILRAPYVRDPPFGAPGDTAMTVPDCRADGESGALLGRSPVIALRIHAYRRSCLGNVPSVYSIR
jgi:hypothetical protein